MVTINKIENTKIKTDGDYIFCELSAKSSDTKPTEIDDKKLTMVVRLLKLTPANYIYMI